jgi:hypothetical protein
LIVNAGEPSRRSIGLLALAALLLVHAIGARMQAASATPAIDYYTAWSVPHAAIAASFYTNDGQRDIATALTREAARLDPASRQALANSTTAQLYDGRVDATGSPFLYWMVGVFSSGDYDTDLDRFALFSLFCMLVATVVMCRLLAYPMAATMLAIVVLLSIYVPTSSDVKVGNINEIQLLCLALFAYFMARSWRGAAGLTLGAGVMLKPNLAFIAVLAVSTATIDRDYRGLARLLAGMAVAALICFAVSTIHFGAPAIWIAFIRSLPRTLDASPYPIEHANFALPMLILQATGWDVSSFVLLALLGVFIAILWVTRGRNERAERADAGSQSELRDAFALAGAGCAIVLLSSKLVWLHYYVLLIPPLLFLLRPTPAGGTWSRSDTWRTAGASCALALLSRLAFSSTERSQNPAVAQAMSANLAAMLLTALVLYDVWQRRSAGSLRSASGRAP